MTLAGDFGPNDIVKQIEKTSIKGRHLIFIDDFLPTELENLFKTAVMLEPFWRYRIPLLEGKVLCTQFFQPSTRTRFSHETAMLRLGGNVITESNPLVSSAAAKGESLYDTLRVTSQYADVIVLRHPDEGVIDTIKQLGSTASPIISGGYGNVTHPTQGLLDMYTAYRALGGDFKKMTVMIATPDLSRARSGQSFGLGLAHMGARLIYSGTTGLETSDIIREKLKEMTGDPGRDDFLKKMAEYYFTLEGLQRIKWKSGKTVGLMHSLPRNEGEFDFAIDASAHELYFKQIGFSVPLRMSLLANICGV